MSLLLSDSVVSQQFGLGVLKRRSLCFQEGSSREEAAARPVGSADQHRERGDHADGESHQGKLNTPESVRSHVSVTRRLTWRSNL